MYDPDDMEPGTLAPGELNAMPPHFGLTQEEHPDFCAYRETPFGNHGFHSHLVDHEKLRKNIAMYYGMISFMDQQIGRILDSLDRLGIADNTMVVFTTDHGHFLGQHGLTAKGAFHYEDLICVCRSLCAIPATFPANATSSAMQALIDLAPTFLSAAGIPIPGIMQGVDQLPVWRGEQATARDNVSSSFATSRPPCIYAPSWRTAIK